MSFLGMGTLEILIILLVAFIFLGPERMIDAARTLGKWTGELRRMGSTVQAEMDDFVNINTPTTEQTRNTSNNTSNRSGSDRTAPPLDQEHPEETPESDSDAQKHTTDGPVAFRSSTDSSARAQHGETRNSHKEENA